MILPETSSHKTDRERCFSAALSETVEKPIGFFDKVSCRTLRVPEGNPLGGRPLSA